MIRVVSKKESLTSQLENADDFICIDCTSHNNSEFWAKGLSPFYLGPVECYDGLIASNMENAWQYTKVYKDQVDENYQPTQKYFDWRNKGFQSPHPHRYPKGKGAKPEYSYWKQGESYYRISYTDARKVIYLPLYAKLVVKTPAYQKLKEYVDKGYSIALSDFDGYNNYDYNLNYKEVVNNPHKKMGHAFVIAMLLEGLIEVVDGEVIYSKELIEMPSKY